MKRSGFTLVEMLVVIGIIAILVGAGISSFSKMTKSAERARAQELVSNASTALSAYFIKEGTWAKKLREQSGNQLNADVAKVLAKKGYFSLTLDENETELAGADKFGIVTPWAAAAIKRVGSSAALAETKVGNSSSTLQDHILYYAIDIDGNGVVDNSESANSIIDNGSGVRTTAMVWCIGKSGGNDQHKPWPYSEASRHDDVYSWVPGQVVK